MSQESYRAKAYLLEGCPFSFKFLLFMAESRQLGRIDIVRCKSSGSELERIKAMLSERTGKSASFPTVEIEPGTYKSDSDALIDHYTDSAATTPDDLPALSFYRETIFPQLVEKH